MKPTHDWKKTTWIMFGVQALSALAFSIVFPFLPLYVKSLKQISGLGVEFLAGAVFSAQAMTMMVASPIWGVLADRFGRKLMVERALFGGAVVIFLMAHVGTAEGLVALRALQGLVTGSISASNALVAASVPRRRMGHAMGILQVGLTLGIAVGPFFGGLLADSFGYRTTFHVTAMLLGMAGFIVWIWVPEMPLCDSPDSVWEFGLIRNWRRILKTRGVVQVYTLRFLVYLGRMMPIPMIPFFIASLMTRPLRINTVTGLIFGVSAMMGAITAFFSGRMGDRTGHVRILTVCAFLGGVFYLPQTWVSSVGQLLVLQALSGAALGGTLPALSALLAVYSEPGEEGAVYGLDSSVISASRTIAPLLGAEIGAWLGLRTTFLVTGCIFIILAALTVSLLSRSETREQ